MIETDPQGVWGYRMHIETLLGLGTHTTTCKSLVLMHCLLCVNSTMNTQVQMLSYVGSGGQAMLHNTVHAEANGCAMLCCAML